MIHSLLVCVLMARFPDVSDRGLPPNRLTHTTRCGFPRGKLSVGAANLSRMLCWPIMLSLLVPIGTAPRQRHRRPPAVEAHARVVVAVDFGCTSPSPLFRKRQLERVALRAIGKDWWGTVWANRAFAYDLNGDGRPEYIVPLQCSAVGNCDWGIFTVGPLRLIGNIPGEYLYIRRRTASWAAITTSGHISVSESELRSYAMRGGRYTEVGSRFSEKAEVPLPRALRFLGTVRPTCSRSWDVGAPRHR